MLDGHAGPHGRATRRVVLLVLAILLVPALPLGAQVTEELPVPRPSTTATDQDATEDPCAVPPEAPDDEDEAASDDPAEEPCDQEDDEGSEAPAAPPAPTDEAAPPAVPTPTPTPEQPAPTPRPSTEAPLVPELPATEAPPGQLGTAEGEDPEEVAAPPGTPDLAPPPGDPAAGAPADPAAPPAQLDPSAAGLEPPPVDYGPNLVPSLQTATAPSSSLDGSFDGGPSVPAPMVAGDDPASPASAPQGGAATTPSAGGTPTTPTAEPSPFATPSAVLTVAASSLDVVRPTWYATALAVLVVVAAAVWATAVRVRNGDEVLPVLSGAVRPADVPAWLGRSVRPADLPRQAGHSIRP